MVNLRRFSSSLENFTYERKTMSTSSQPTDGTLAHCDHCNKAIRTERLSLGFLIKDALNNIFNLERGLFFTIWSLLKQPGEVCREFVSGNRFKYMNPFRFLIVAATFSVIAEAITGSTDIFNLMNIEGKDDESVQMVSMIMRDYLNLVILGSAPFYAIGSWIIFRKPKWNLAEYLVVNSYALSLIVILSGIVSFLPGRSSDQVEPISNGSPRY